ncbi:29541_t:CDS:2, partial [Racocetra persica]
MAKLQFSYDSIVGGVPNKVYGSEYELTMNVYEINKSKQNVEKINRIRIIAHHDDILFFQQYFGTRKKYCFEMDDSDISRTKKELGMFNVAEINFDKTRKYDKKKITLQGIIAARAIFKAKYDNAYLYLDDNTFDKAILGEEEINETNDDTSSNDNNDSNSDENGNPPPTLAEIFQQAWNGKDGNSQLKSLINKYKVTETEFLNATAENYLTSDRQIDLTALEGFFKIAFGDRVVEPEQQEPKQNNTPDNYEQTKTDAIQKINEALNQEPKILSSELDKVLADIRSKRQSKEKESKLNEEIQNAQNKS